MSPKKIICFLFPMEQNYPEFGPKPNLTSVFGDGNPPGLTYGNNYHHHLSGSFNGHIIGTSEVRQPVNNMEEGLSPEPTNRHQMMNNRLKSLIQSRQSSKSSVQSGQVFPPSSSSPPNSQPAQGQNFTGQSARD